MEEWQSGLMQRSWKPSWWKPPGVRIPILPPKRGRSASKPNDFFVYKKTTEYLGGFFIIEIFLRNFCTAIWFLHNKKGWHLSTMQNASYRQTWFLHNKKVDICQPLFNRNLLFAKVFCIAIWFSIIEICYLLQNFLYSALIKQFDINLIPSAFGCKPSPV